MREFERIAKIIRFLDEHHSKQPDLETLAAQAGLSPFHFHRLFSHWAGITPKDFLQCLTLSHAKRLLDAGESVLETALGAGLSGPGRLHDLCVSLEAASIDHDASGCLVAPRLTARAGVRRTWRSPTRARRSRSGG